MVFFTCCSCGQSLKKNQVERHSYQCRGCEYVTCIDCSKDFWGNDYASHNSCLTEDQRYGGTSYVPKELKGQKKQDAWISQIQASIAAARNMNPHLRKLFEHIMRFDNVPRKKAKFIRFLQNNNYKNNSLIEEAWEFFEKVSKSDVQSSTKCSKPVESTSCPGAPEETENQEKPEVKSKRQRKEERRQKHMKIEKKDKKRKIENEDGEEAEAGPKKKKKKLKEEVEEINQDDEETNQENEEPTGDLDNSFNQEINLTKKSGTFSWKKAITYVLQDAPEEGMKLKKLKRKLTSLYVGTKSEEAARKSPMEIDALVQKKLNMKNEKYVIVKERVKLRKSD